MLELLKHPVALAAVLVLGLFFVSCSSNPPPPPHLLHCPVLAPIGSYGVKHKQDTRNEMYPSNRWRCVTKTEMR